MSCFAVTWELEFTTVQESDDFMCGICACNWLWCFDCVCKDGPTKDYGQEAGPVGQQHYEPNNTSVSPWHSACGGTSQEATQEKDPGRAASPDALAKGQRHVRQMFETKVRCEQSWLDFAVNSICGCFELRDDCIRKEVWVPWQPFFDNHAWSRDAPNAS